MTLLNCRRSQIQLQHSSLSRLANSQSPLIPLTPPPTLRTKKLEMNDTLPLLYRLEDSLTALSSPETIYTRGTRPLYSLPSPSSTFLLYRRLPPLPRPPLPALPLPHRLQLPFLFHGRPARPRPCRRLDIRARTRNTSHFK